ncbi:Uncharacterised protein PB.1513, partial [Pycnogonum litorale]
IFNMAASLTNVIRITFCNFRRTVRCGADLNTYVSHRLTSKKCLSTVETPNPELLDDIQGSGDEIDRLTLKHRRESTGIHGSGCKFSEFPIEPKLLARLEKLGYDEPFEIQSKTLEHTLNGRNVIGRAKTGSGKTLAFAIPIVQKIYESTVKRGERRTPKAIVIAPTRELCHQIYKSVQELESFVRCVALYGGASMQRQMSTINNGVDVICATPGRLNDHLERGTFHLDNLKFLCLDEADELLNPNFKDQIENVLSNSPSEKQMLLFSATMPSDFINVIKKYVPNPEYVDITSGQKYKSPESIKHQVICSPRKHHLSVLCSILERVKPERCIVFLRTKEQTRRTAELIRNARLQGVAANYINSDLSQNKRESVMDGFRHGDVNILCATDVAARGLDIPEVDLIVQVEPPCHGADYYVHRAGRTGRAGRPGLSIVVHANTKQEQEIISEIELVVPLEHVGEPEDTEEMLKKLDRTCRQHLLAYELSNPYPETKP